MEIKTILKDFIHKEGIKNGKTIIYEIVDSIESEYDSYNSKLRDLEKEMFEKHLDPRLLSKLTYKNEKKSEDEIRTSIYRVDDPVEPIIIGIWDNNISEGKTYRVSKVIGDHIVIRDDSGELNPYLKKRFINTSEYLPSIN